MLKNYSLFSKQTDKLDESAPRIPNSEEYWTKKGKKGKKVALYFHDDLDGIYSAIAMKGYLEKKGFEIEKYGIINYQEGWSTTVLDEALINIALDYAENIKGIDVYIDHHGKFEEGENKGEPTAVKTHTGSAYEGIMDQLGLPVDSNVLSIIDMVDSAKYDDYKVDIKRILTFDFKEFKNKLEFAAAFNQMLKRSDHKTFIEVVANSKDINPSIYNIFRLFKILYPANNLNNVQIKQLAKAGGFLTDDGKPDIKALVAHIKRENPKLMRDFEKDFIKDAEWRLGQMAHRTWGGDQRGPKQYIDSQEKFKALFGTVGRGYVDKETGEDVPGNPKVSMPGYQIIGTMCFVPSGTWANALRARSLLETHLLNDERIPIIPYRVLKTSPMYNELLSKNGEKMELIGDISDFLTKDKKFITFNPKQDVTNDPKIEGISGEILVQGEHVVFKAKQPIFWILLQYGNTLQVASLHKFDLYVKEYLPKINGEPVEDLGKYCDNLLMQMCKEYGYNILTVPEMTTKAGGHKGIGSISNIFGEVPNGVVLGVPDPKHPDKKVNVEAAPDKDKIAGTRFLDLIKNTMISELSGIKFDDLTMPWGDPDEKPAPKPKDTDMNKKVLTKQQIRKAQDVEKQYQEWDKEDIMQNVERLKKSLNDIGLDGLAKQWGISTEKARELIKKQYPGLQL